MKPLAAQALLAFSVVPALAWGQAAAPAHVVRDLESLQPHTLSAQELQQLMPGAAVRRVNEKGNSQGWTNGADGSFVASSDNRATSGRASTAPGKWHITDDGRYCVLIEWKHTDAEEWCRAVIKTSDGYYAAKSDRLGTEKVYRLEITGAGR